MRRRFPAGQVLLLVLAALSARGHGLEFVRVEGATSLRALYSDGRPASFCDVTVRAPGEAEDFQQGSTDRNGVFSFVPDRPGAWQITVDDGMGHRAETAMEVAADRAIAPLSRTTAGGLSAALVGVSLILGIFALWALLGRRRRPCT